MALSIFDRYITQTDSGETVPGAILTVNLYGGGLSVLWQDAAGTIPAANPFTADSDGRVQFYAESGKYNMQADFNSQSVYYPDVLITEQDKDNPESYLELRDNLSQSIPIYKPSDTIQIASTTNTGINGDGVVVAATGSEYTDNGGTIIVANGGTSTAGMLVWLRSYTGAVNIKWFGAIGNGVADDTAAMDAAISASKNVFIPSGNYMRTGSAFSVDSANDVSITGEGWNSKIERTDIGDVISITNSNRVTVANLYVKGVKTYLSGSGCIELETCTQFLVTGCYTTDSSRQGIKISVCDYGIVSNNVVTNSYQDGIMIRSGSRWVSVVGNTCYLNGDPLFVPPVGEGIHLFDAQHCTVVGNTCHDNSDHGIAVEGGDYSTITGNVCHSNTVSGLSLTLEGSHKCEGLVASHNVFDGNGEDGIAIGECDDISISGNTIANNTRYGINITAGSSAAQNRVSVEGNNIFDNTDNGIFIDWNFEQGIIRGNRIRGSASYGILINRANTDDCIVTDNKISGFTVSQIQDSGTNTRIFDNDVGNKLSGRVTLSSGAATVTLSSAEPSSGFIVALDGAANETFYVTGKSTTGFTINSSNGASTAQVDWKIVDSKA